MFPHALAGARAAGLALLTAALLAACGSDDSPQTPTTTPAASRLVVDAGTAAPVAGDTLTLKATLLAVDGSEVKGASFAWTSSDPAVATVVSASDKAPAAVSASVVAPVGTYATVQTLAAGAADITATATLADGSRVTSMTHLVVQAAPAKSYTLVLTPATLAVTAGGASQTVTATVRRSDGVDGVADLANWTWTSDDATFVATPAADGRSVQVASPNSASATGTATLIACADAPTRNRLCANAALTRNASLPPTYTVGGTVSGLATGKSVQLSDTNGDTQVISGNGGFTMPTPRLGATAYSVTVAAQPAGQTCTVSNSSGTLAAANVTNIAVTCVQAQFVVVPNRADRTISVYRVNPLNGALASVPGSPFSSGGQVNDMAFLPSGLVGFGVLVDSSTIVGFQLDPASGVLSPVAGSVPTRFPSPQAVTMHPSGQWLFVGSGPGVQAYKIASDTYTLTDEGGTWNGDGTGQTNGVAVAPNGTSLYGSNARANQVLGLRFDQSSGFEVGQESIFTAGGTGSIRLVVAPNGGHLYVANFGTNTVGVATLDGSGNAAAVTSFPTSAAAPVDVAITPSGNFVYVLGTTSNSIAGFRLDSASSDGLPVGVLPTTAAAVNGQRLSIDPTGRYLYTASLMGSLYGFEIDASTGALTPVPGSPFATGNVNTAVVVVEPKP